MIKELKEKVDVLRGLFDIDGKMKEISDLDRIVLAQDFWSDQNNAKTTMAKLDGLKI